MNVWIPAWEPNGNNIYHCVHIGKPVQNLSCVDKESTLRNGKYPNFQNIILILFVVGNEFLFACFIG